MNLLEKENFKKLTENGDESYSGLGKNLADILFMAPYFQNNLDGLHLSDSEKEKWFAMMLRDPRYGFGYKNVGRRLMKLANLTPEQIVQAGRFDDLLYIPTDNNLDYWKREIKAGNGLAKKWAPRLTGKDGKKAKLLAKTWKMSEKEYRSFIKYDQTVEYKLSYAEKENQNPLEELFKQGEYSHPLVDTIDFSKVPSNAMVKYFNAFRTREDTKERFAAYLEAVKSGEKKLNISTTNVYDIYKNRDKIDADLFFDKLEKIKISCLPVVDTSGSMWCDDAIGKALSIGHYLGKCSTFCNGYVVPFSSRPHLMKIKGNNYKEEIASLHTGDCSNTNLAAVMKLLKDLKEFPDYLVVLSDMEFDWGSAIKKNELMDFWKKNEYPTKIIWWNFNARNKTCPEMDEFGNIYLSGYSPMLLKYMSVGFDNDQFIEKLIEEYKKHF